MLPVIYTTYGTAMGHQPEVLGESGGLRPLGGGRRGGPDGPAAERPRTETSAPLGTIKSAAVRVRFLVS
jgi:hypothetical protein